ncbi:Dehydrin COR47 [Linum perenne]
MAEEYRNHEEQKQHDLGTTGGSVESTDRGIMGLFGKKKEEEQAAASAAVPATLLHHPPHQGDQVISSQFDDKVHVSPNPPPHDEAHHLPQPEEKKSGIFHRSNSSSSSSSEEEYEEAGERRRRKKDKKDKKNKHEVVHTGAVLGGEPFGAAHHQQHPEEKKGVMGKIKDKLPGHGEKTAAEEEAAARGGLHQHPVAATHQQQHPVAVTHQHPGEPKMGAMEKIKDKLPGHGEKTAAQEEAVGAGAVQHHGVPTNHPLNTDSTHAVGATHQHPEEKKGIMDKIKEKLPGYHPKGSADEADKEKDHKGSPY